MKNQLKTLKKLLSPGGDLEIMKNRMIAMQATVDDDTAFGSLLNMLSWVTEFQYNHHKKMESIKSFYKESTSSDIFMLFGPLHGMIKRCGMDQYKNHNSVTFVSNHFNQKKDRFGLRNLLPLTDKHVFLHTDFYSVPQRLSFIRAQASRPTSPLNKAMVKELRRSAVNFVREYSENISQKIAELQALEL